MSAHQTLLNSFSNASTSVTALYAPYALMHLQVLRAKIISSLFMTGSQRNCLNLMVEVDHLPTNQEVDEIRPKHDLYTANRSNQAKKANPKVS